MYIIRSDILTDGTEKQIILPIREYYNGCFW